MHMPVSHSKYMNSLLMALVISVNKHVINFWIDSVYNEVTLMKGTLQKQYDSKMLIQYHGQVFTTISAHFVNIMY